MTLRAPKLIKLPQRPLEPVRKSVEDLYALQQLVGELNSLKSAVVKTLAETNRQAIVAGNRLVEITRQIRESSQTIELLKDKNNKLKIVQKGDRGEQGEAGRVNEEEIIQTILSKIRQPENGKDAIVDYDKIIEEVISYFPSEEKLIKKISQLIPKPKDGKSGKDADEERILEAIFKRFDEGKVKFKAKNIEGLQDADEIVRRYIARGSIRGGGDTVSAGSNITIAVVNGIKVISASAGGGTPTLETPTGTINGSNTSFTITQTPIANSLMLFFNGQLLKENTDFTLSGTTITFTVAPTNQFNNATLQAFYRY